MKNLITLLAIVLVSSLPFNGISQCILEININDIKEVKKDKSIDKNDMFSIYLRNECRKDYLYFINDDYYHSGPIIKYLTNNGTEYYLITGHKFNMEIFISPNTITLIENKGKRKKVYTSSNFDIVRSGY